MGAVYEGLYFDEIAGDRPLTTPDRYDYQLTFVKKDGKWEVEKAYNSDSFMEKFEGNLS